MIKLKDPGSDNFQPNELKTTKLRRKQRQKSKNKPILATPTKDLDIHEEHEMLQRGREKIGEITDESRFDLFDLREETYKLKKKKPTVFERNEENKNQKNDMISNSNKPKIYSLDSHLMYSEALPAPHPQSLMMLAGNIDEPDKITENDSPKAHEFVKKDTVLFSGHFMEINQIYHPEESFKRTFQELNLMNLSQPDGLNTEEENEGDLKKKLKTENRPKHSNSESEDENKKPIITKTFAELKAKRRRRLAKMEPELQRAKNFEIDSDEGFFEPQITIKSGFHMYDDEFMDHMSDEPNEDLYERSSVMNLLDDSQENQKSRSRSPFTILKHSKDEKEIKIDKEEYLEIESDKNQHQNLSENEPKKKKNAKQSGNLDDKKAEEANESSEESSSENEKVIDNQVRRSLRERRELRDSSNRGISNSNYGFTYVDYIKYKTQRLKIEISLRALLVMNIHSHLSKLEIIGMLGGRVLSNDQICVEEAIPCQNISGSSDTHSVEMDPSSQVEAQERLEKIGYTTLGWYHSHPTFQVLIPIPSQIDQETHLNHQTFHRDSPYIGVIVAPYSIEWNSSKSKRDVFVFHVSNNETYKLNYQLKSVTHLTVQDLDEIVDIYNEKVITDYKNSKIGIKFKENWKKGETHKAKILNSVKALLEQNFNKIMEEDSSAESMSNEEDETQNLNKGPKPENKGLYLGDKKNIQKMLNSLEALIIEDYDENIFSRYLTNKTSPSVKIGNNLRRQIKQKYFF